LFLPFGEIHDLGLFFLNYYLKLKGKKTVYLGKSIPFDNLFYVNSQIKNITWITYFMIDTTTEEKTMFLDNVEKLVSDNNNTSIIVGNIWDDFSKKNKNKKMFFKTSLQDLIAN